MQAHATIKRTCLALAISKALLLPVAEGATITVDVGNDVSADDMNCTLREAVASANTNPAMSNSGCVAGDPGVDTIVFDAGLSGAISLTQNTDILINESLNINGPGNGIIDINGAANGSYSTFTINAGTVSINSLTLSGVTKSGVGGALYLRNSSHLNLDDVVVANNSANIRGGGLSARDSATVTITDSVISGGSSVGGGAIFVRDTTSIAIVNSTLAANSANVGGAIYATYDSTVRLTGSTVGGVAAGNTSPGNGGGAILVGSAKLFCEDTDWIENSANNGGAISTVNVNNTATHIEINGCTFSQNSSTNRGGAIATSYAGEVVIDQSTFSDNTAGLTGGAISNTPGLGPMPGRPTVTLSNSTVSGNMAVSMAGIYNQSDMTMINSTVSGNVADNFYGGLFSGSDSSTTIINSSIIQNTATLQKGGGLSTATDSVVTLINTIVSGNVAAGTGAEINNHVNGTINADAANLFASSALTSVAAFENFSPGASDINAASDNPSQSAPLADIVAGLAANGGPTQTHALVEDSPAIDAGNSALCTANMVLLDQRGIERDSRCDIGAYEDPRPQPSGSFFIVPTANGKTAIFEL